MTVGSLQAQVDGLWGVTKVTVGNQVLTPVAKWIKFDHEKQSSGNGWLQHTTGTYTYNRKNSTLEIKDYNEPSDEFGPFTITIPGPDDMRWTRMEEGENVIVELKRIEAISMSPSDEIHGLWGLEKALKADVDITAQYDPQKKYSMFIQWTHNYVINTGAEKITGLWYVNAHRPELRFLRMGHEQELDKWEISIPWPPEGKTLVLKGMSDQNKEIVLLFKPLTQFPK
jgi:hypothetical protein